MKITASICTLNRAESLRRTLNSLTEMQVPNDLDWEVVIVTGNCTDHTDAVIESFADRMPVHRELEPLRGLSRARNRAVDVAQGDYIVWTDDDVVVDPGWLVAYIEAFRRWPGATVFGGRVVPRFATPPPKWLARIEGFPGFAARDFGDVALPLSISDDRLPFGANFAVRSAEQRKYRYNPDLGAGSPRGLLGEETDVVQKILKAGGTGYWIPESRVTHYIDDERVTIGYIARFCTAMGATEAFRFPEPAAKKFIWFGAPRWLWRRLLEEWLRYRLRRLISPAAVWLPYLMSYEITRGKISYWRSSKITRG